MIWDLAEKDVNAGKIEPIRRVIHVPALETRYVYIADVFRDILILIMTSSSSFWGGGASGR